MKNIKIYLWVVINIAHYVEGIVMFNIMKTQLRIRSINVYLDIKYKVSAEIRFKKINMLLLIAVIN